MEFLIQSFKTVLIHYLRNIFASYRTFIIYGFFVLNFPRLYNHTKGISNVLVIIVSLVSRTVISRQYLLRKYLLNEQTFHFISFKITLCTLKVLMLGQEILMTKEVKRYNTFSQFIKVPNLNISMPYKLSILYLGPNCFNLENINYIFLHLS